MTQPRTRKWTPGDEQATTPEEDARAIDPETSRALASLRSFVQPSPASTKTLTGYARPGESQHRSSQPPPAPVPAPHRTTAAWSPSAPKQPPPLPPYRRARPRVDPKLATEQVAVPPPAPVPSIGEPPAAAASPIASEPPPPAVVSVAPRAHETRDWKAWSGWVTAAAVCAFGAAFYTMAYLPLRSDFSSLEQASATQLKQRDTALATLQAELAASRSREQQAAAAAAPPPVQVAPVEIEAHSRRARAKNQSTDAPAEPKQAAAEPKVAAEPKPTAEPKEPVAESKHAAHDEHEASEGKAKGKVDVAAASAATAALEAEMYGSRPKAESGASPSGSLTGEAKATGARPTATLEGKEAPSRPSEAAPQSGSEKKDSLADIERGKSDDPLEGL